MTGNDVVETIFTEKELKALEIEEQLKRNLFDKNDGLKQIPQYVFSKIV